MKAYFDEDRFCFGVTNCNLIYDQGDKIGLLLKGLCNNFSKPYGFFGAIGKNKTLKVKAKVTMFWATEGKNGPLSLQHLFTLFMMSS